MATSSAPTESEPGTSTLMSPEQLDILQAKALELENCLKLYSQGASTSNCEKEDVSNNIVVRGVPEDTNFERDPKLTKLKLQYLMATWFGFAPELEFAMRIGRFRNGNARPILARLPTLKHKMEIMACKPKLAKLHSSAAISIDDDCGPDLSHQKANLPSTSSTITSSDYYNHLGARPKKK